MKLKMLLLAVFVAGIGASYALADDGGHHRSSSDCQKVRLRGTIAPQTLTVTADGTGEHNSFAAGTQVALAVGAAGQTVRVNVEACSTGTGTAAQLSVRSLELRVVQPQAATTTTGTTTTGTTATGTTTTGMTTTESTTTTSALRNGGDDHGDHGGKGH